MGTHYGKVSPSNTSLPSKAKWDGELHPVSGCFQCTKGKSTTTRIKEPGAPEALCITILAIAGGKPCAGSHATKLIWEMGSGKQGGVSRCHTCGQGQSRMYQSTQDL